MAPTMITHLLLDFFGTIVDYSPSRTEQDYSGSHDLLQKYGSTLSYEEFLATGDQVFGQFDALSASDLSEFSMHDAGVVILERALGRPPVETEIDAFVEAYLRDWNAAVHYPEGMSDLLHDLAGRYRLAVVSNTHSRALVPDHLEALGVADLVDSVVLSVEVGHRKPHPMIYRAALDELGIGAERAAFVGDSYQADYIGPQQQGIRAFLIDPHRSAPVPQSHRLSSLFELRRKDLGHHLTEFDRQGAI